MNKIIALFKIQFNFVLGNLPPRFSRSQRFFDFSLNFIKSLNIPIYCV